MRSPKHVPKDVFSFLPPVLDRTPNIRYSLVAIVWLCRRKEKAMPFIPLAACVKVALELQANSESIVNTLWFRHIPDSVDASAMADLANAIDLWFTNWMAPDLPIGCVLQRITVKDWSAPNGLVVEVSPATSGTLSGTTMPAQNTFVVTFKTGFGGRSFRGRNYWPLLLESEQSTQFVDGGKAADILLVYESLITLVAAQAPDWEWVVASFYADNQPRVDGLATPVIGVGYSNLRVKTQRNRNNGK